MLKRMSILVRLPSDSRSTFSTKWQHHGTLVSVLPGIHSYIQNHVEEQFGDPAIKADGIVELRFSTLDAMNNAFSTEAAKPVRADEPGFLGHGTGYILEADSPVLTAVGGNKLVVTLTNGSSAETAQVIEDSVGSLAGFRDLVRDRVSSILARDEMKEDPNAWTSFFISILTKRSRLHMQGSC